MMMIIFFNFILFFIQRNFTFENLIVEWINKIESVLLTQKNIQNLLEKKKCLCDPSAVEIWNKKEKENHSVCYSVLFFPSIFFFECFFCPAIQRMERGG